MRNIFLQTLELFAYLRRLVDTREKREEGEVSMAFLLKTCGVQIEILYLNYLIKPQKIKK